MSDERKEITNIRDRYSGRYDRGNLDCTWDIQFCSSGEFSDGWNQWNRAYFLSYLWNTNIVFHNLQLMAIFLNIPIAIGCFKILGRSFFLRSIRTIVITSVIMDYIAPLFPVYEGDRLLAAICTGILSGLGFALIYMRNSSTGGVDFVMLSVKAKKPHISMGKITFVLDFIVVLIGTIVVSRDMDSLIYGIIITYLISIVLDKVMYGIDAGKLTLIITDFPERVAEKIDTLVGRGATFVKAEGSFSHEKKDIVMCACNNKQMFAIRNAVKEIDRHAFVIIMESNEVLGEGFKNH